MKSIKIFSILVLIWMIGVSTWASIEANVFTGGKYILEHRWGIATLSDCYFGFYFCYLWMFYKERSNALRFFWFILVTLFGTIAISVYLLIQIFQLKKDACIEDLLLQKSA